MKTKDMYQLPKTMSAQTVERPGHPDGSLHLKPGRAVKLEAGDIEAIRKTLPRVAAALVPLHKPRKVARPSQLPKASHDKPEKPTKARAKGTHADASEALPE